MHFRFPLFIGILRSFFFIFLLFVSFFWNHRCRIGATVWTSKAVSSLLRALVFSIRPIMWVQCIATANRTFNAYNVKKKAFKSFIRRTKQCWRNVSFVPSHDSPRIWCVCGIDSECGSCMRFTVYFVLFILFILVVLLPEITFYVNLVWFIKWLNAG